MKKKKQDEITKDTFPVYKPNPVLAGLPEHLKDPKNYEKIQRALLETLASTHSHGELMDWAACGPCQRRMHEHAEMQRRLGFRSPQQYMAWKKVHETIKERVKLPKYNS